MALSDKRYNLKQVPWFSLAEWHDVYKKIYSNDTTKQTKAYETLLAWKARMPKLPVGVDSTLLILQVCLRDREWTTKIDNGELPMYREQDLSLMYSIVIMKFLNHISNIGQMRQKSLFHIAQQLKIPEWIVGLRHNAAHGWEFVPLGVLRIAINILFEWLHEEYWAPELLAMEQIYANENNTLEEEEEVDKAQTFRDLIELWTSVSLYLHAGYQSVSHVPDTNLQVTLQDLWTYMLSQDKRSSDNDDKDERMKVDANIENEESYNLRAAQSLLLSEISAYLSRNLSALEKNNAICEVLCKIEAFLPNSDIMHIFLQKRRHKMNSKRKFVPSNMLQFWKDIIILLHKKELLKALIFKLLDILDEEREIKEKKVSAALWINTIVCSFVQLDIALSVCRTMEYDLSKLNKQLSTKELSHRVKIYVHGKYPYLQNVLWLDISSTVPCFLDVNFVLKLLTFHANEFPAELIKTLLKFVTPKIDEKTRQHLLQLLRIFTLQDCNDDKSDNDERIYTVDDLREDGSVNEEASLREKEGSEEKTCLLADQAIRNLQWQPAVDTYQWARYPIGLLPWQDSLESLGSLKTRLPKHSTSNLESQIVAGIVNNKNLRMESRINWDNVLRKRGQKRNRDEDVADVIMNRALQVAKKQKRFSEFCTLKYTDTGKGVNDQNTREG